MKIITFALILLYILQFALLTNDKPINREDLKLFIFEAYVKKIDYMFLPTDAFFIDHINIGFEIDNFAEENDKVYLVRIRTMNTGGFIHDGSLFVNPKNSKTHFLNGLWNRKDIYATRDWKRKGLRIKNTRSTEEKALKLAQAAYIKKLNLKKINDEEFKIDKIRIGWKIPDFAEAVDEVWEATITSKDNKFMGLLWIHPVTENVHYITGPWVEKQ